MKRNRSCGIKGLAAAPALALPLAGCAGTVGGAERVGGFDTAESGSGLAEGTGSFLPLENPVRCAQKFTGSGRAKGAYIRLTRPDYAEVLAYVDYNSRYAVLGEADSRQKNRVLAPGNFRRSAGYGQAGLPWGQLAGRTVRYSGELCRAIGGVLAAAALLTLLLALTSRRQLGPALWLWAGALACHGAMLASPTYPLRSMLGPLVYALAAGLYCLEQLSVSPLPAAALCGVLAVGAAGLVPGAAADLAALRAVTDGRAAYILAQKEQGIRQVTAPVALPAATRFNPLWGDALTDLAQNPAGERNRALALYYGVETVRGDPARACLASGENLRLWPEKCAATGSF